MKKIIFLPLLSLLLSPLFLQAQTPIDVKINPLGALFGSPDISAEFIVSDNFGIEPRVGVTFGSVEVLDVNYSQSGFDVGTFGKYYFSPEKGGDRFYAGPYVRYRATENTVDQTVVSNRKFAGGFMLGYKWLSAKNVSLELGVGFGRSFVSNYSTTDTSVDLADFPLLNFDSIGVLAIGYRFNGN